MTLIQAILLGAVEGLTEFLPISSTAHLMIADRLLGVTSSGFVSSFNIAIQLGAILAVVILFAGRLRRDRALWLKLGAAFIPTALVGFVFYKLIKEVLLESLGVVAVALTLGGVALIVMERWFDRRAEAGRELTQLTWRQASLIGLAQSLAVIPGVSRAAATIVGGRALGFSRPEAALFSFLLAVPTMVAATAFDLLQTSIAFSGRQWGILGLGAVVAFVIAWLTVRWFIAFVSRHSFAVFGWYRLALGLLVFLWLI